jgi:hypothetical protein
MPLLKRRRVLAAKIEATSGTAEALTSSEGAFNAYDVMIQPEIEFETREVQGSFGSQSAVPGGYKGKATFRTDCSWDGTATEPSWADVLLPACGWVKSSQVFSPRSEAPGTNVKTLTIGCYLDGMFKSLSGCAGTFKLVCPTGRMAYIEWEFSGVWITPTAQTIIAPTYPTALPLRYANATSTWNSVALCVENITLDAGNEVVMRECASGNGFESAIVVNRQVKVTGNPETLAIGSQNRYLQFLEMTEGVLTWGLDGPTNSVLTISAPKAQIVANTEGERNRMVIDELEWQCNQNASTVDSDITMTFTAAS